MVCLQDQAPCSPNTHALLQEKIRELENEISQPERRELAKARRKVLKEVSAVLADKTKSAEEKLIFLEQKIISQVFTSRSPLLHSWAVIFSRPLCDIPAQMGAKTGTWGALMPKFHALGNRGV